MDNATKHALCATCIHIGGLLAESISQGNSALVQEMFDRAVELEPENSMVYVNRAAMWQILKTEDRALQDTERALQLDPSHVAATLKMIVSIMREVRTPKTH
jgi:Tfp pilus assembly protein PilF